ncbi:MAG: helix-turn-helix transcriptional regulator [Pseudobutyrivibrio sp.]|nr:helix-turn-helix transcriptional regulator [Pseudobutyrivibrio sp.]
MKIDSSKDFGQMIKKRRKQLGYTQQYLAEYTGLSASYISNLENGKGTAEIGKAIYLANLLGLDIIMKERGE